MSERKMFTFDPRDLSGMRKLMDQYGDSEFPFFGTNENGEDISISIFHDKIVTVTLQANGWERKNIYYGDGISEELFCGRWTESEMS